MEIDNEDYYGRKTYPDIGGCYYSTRLAVAEKYMEMKRGGGAITWREIYPGFNLPVGAWYGSVMLEIPTIPRFFPIISFRRSSMRFVFT